MSVSRTAFALTILPVTAFLFAGQVSGSSIQYTMNTYTLPGFTPIAISGDYIAGDLIVAGVVHAALLHNGSLTDLGAGPAGASATVLGVNSAGQVVGDAAGSGSTRAILWSAGTVTDITPAGMTAASAAGINSSGQVVGINLTNPSAPSDTWFTENLSGGSPTLGGHAWVDAGSGAIQYPGAGGLIGTFVNDNGDVLASPYSTWQYLDVGGSITTVEPSTYNYGRVTGLNNSDELIGWSAYLNDQPFGYSFSSGTGIFTSLGLCPTGINDAGTIVGDLSCLLDNGVFGTAGVRVDGQNYVLSQIVTNLGGVTMYEPIGINSAGQIVGYGTSSTGAALTYLLTETASEAPEPTTSALFV